MSELLPARFATLCPPFMQPIRILTTRTAPISDHYTNAVIYLGNLGHVLREGQFLPDARLGSRHALH